MVATTLSRMTRAARRPRLIAATYVLVVMALAAIALLGSTIQGWAYLLVVILCLPLSIVAYILYFMLVVVVLAALPLDGQLGHILAFVWWSLVAVIQAAVGLRLAAERRNARSDNSTVS